MNLSSFGRRWIVQPDAATANATLFAVIPTLAGGGIQFPATQVPSADPNTLDDYEEGTFTPAFSATSSTFSYAQQTGTYVKIGNTVFFHAVISLNTSGNTLTANALTITGLPFTAAAGEQPRWPLVWFAATTAYVNVYGRVLGGTSTISPQGITAASVSLAGAALLANALLHATNGSALIINGFYYV